MPAINSDSGARAAQPKKKLVKKKRPAPTVPDQADRTRQQTQQGRKPAAQAKGRAPEEQQYLSQAHSVRIRASRQKRESGTTPVGDRPQNRAREMTSPAVQEGVRKARLRVIAKRQADGSRGTRQIKKELAGAGVIASTLSKIGQAASDNIAAHGIGGAGTPGSALPSTRASLAPTKIAQNLAKDVATLPSQAVTSTYAVAAGVKEAAQGRPQRIKKIAKDFDATDPLWNATLAGAAAVTGDSAAAKKRIRAAKTSAMEHPGFAAAEVIGAKGAVGKSAGTVMRSGALGKGAKRVAATDTRADRTLPGTNLTVPRAYSSDVLQKAGDVLADKTRKPDPIMSVRDIRKRVDERVGVSGTDRDPFVEEFAATTNGKVRAFPTQRAAARAADRQSIESAGHEFVAVPFKGVHAIVPKTALERLAEHGDVRPKTTAGRTMSLANDAFRKTVLTTSTSWAAGNVIEAALRGGLAKAGPRSYLQGLRVQRAVKRIDPAKAEELAARVTGGGHYSAAEKTQIKDIAQHYDGTVVEGMAQSLHNFWQHPIPKTTAGVWRTWNQGVFKGMRAVEKQFQVAQLGAAVRRSEFMDGHLMKLSDSAVQEAARGLTNTETQVRFARQVERAYGKYSGFSPSTRMLIAHYSPFVAWFLNSVKFVGDVLPRDHPAALAAIAAAENATEDWRKDHGLDLWMKDAVPGWLQGSIPTPGGGKVRASRFTPFGAFGDLPDTLSGQVLPLYSGPLMALKGLTWNGQKIRPDKDPKTGKTKDASTGEMQAKAALTAIGEFLDATIPVISQAKRVHDKGADAFNPFAPVKPKATTPKIRKVSTAGRVKLPSGGALGDRITLEGSLNSDRVKLP